VALPEVISPLDPAAEEDTAAEEFDTEEFDPEEFDPEEPPELPDDPHPASTTRPAVRIDAVNAVERLNGGSSRRWRADVCCSAQMGCTHRAVRPSDAPL